MKVLYLASAVVVCLAGSGSAGLILELDGANSHQVNLITDGEYGEVLIGSIGSVVAENFMLSDLGEMAAIEDLLPYDPTGIFDLMFWVEVVELPDPSVEVVARFRDMVFDDLVTVVMMDPDDLSVMGSVLLTPEPMSIALVGLGGLLVRRRK